MAASLGKQSNSGQFLGDREPLPMPTDDFFRARLYLMIDLRPPLAVQGTQSRSDRPVCETPQGLVFRVNLRALLSRRWQPGRAIVLS